MSQRAGLVLGSALDQPLFHSAQGVEARALGQAIGGVGLISHHSVQCRLVWIPKHCLLGQHSYLICISVSPSQDTTTAESGLNPLSPHIYKP